MGICKLKLKNCTYEFETIWADLKLDSAHPRSMEIISGGWWLSRTVVAVHEEDRGQNCSWSSIWGLRTSPDSVRWSLKLREVWLSSRRSGAVVGWSKTAWGSWVERFFRGSSTRFWRRSMPELVQNGLTAGWALLRYLGRPVALLEVGDPAIYSGEGGVIGRWGKKIREREKKINKFLMIFSLLIFFLKVCEVGV